MSDVKINLTEAIEPERDDSPYLREPGDYVVRIDKFEDGKSEVKQTPYLEFSFRTTNGQIFSERFYTVPTALWKLKRLVESARQEEVSVRDVSFDPESILDKWVELNLVPEDYTNKDGEQRTKLVIYDMRAADKPTDEKIENLKEAVDGKEVDPF